MSGELEALAVRCEQATGPDRELDCLIWCATAESHFEYHGGDCVLAVQGGFCARLDWKDIPHPTALIDAAMRLTKPNWWLTLGAPLSPEAYGYSREDDRRPRCGFSMIGPPYCSGGHGATLPLAICAAALRTLSQTRAHSQESTTHAS